MGRHHRQSASRFSAIPVALAVLFGIPLGVLLTETVSAQNSKPLVSKEWTIADNSLDTADAPEAPSPWWLVVMPAIPIMGGGLIYTKRRFFGSGLERQECSSSVSSPQPDASSPQSQSDDTEQS